METPDHDESLGSAGSRNLIKGEWDREQAEKTLQASHDQFFAIVEHSPIKVFLFDSQLRLQQMNTQARSVFVGGDPLIGRDFAPVMSVLWPPDVAAQVVGRFRHTLETGESYKQPGFIKVRADQDLEEHYDWEIHRIIFPNGTKGIACYFTDVSRHVRAQQALKKSENQKSAILNAALDAIITMDNEGKIVDFNPAAEQIFGYRREEVIARPLADLIIPERYRKAHHEGLASYLATGVGPVLGRRLELPALRSSGEEFPAELSISRIPASEPPMFTGTLRDITERKNSEKTLLERVQLAALRADISTSLATTESFPVVLQRCAQAMVEHLNGAFARIWTVNEKENCLELKASAGLYTHVNGPHGRIKLGDFKIGRIAQNQEPLFTNDVVNDPNISDPAWAKREGMVAFAGCPMILENKVMGVLAMFAKHRISENVLNELIPIAEGIAQWVRRRRAEEALTTAQLELQNHAALLEATVIERTSQLQEKIEQLESFSYSVSHDMRSPLRAMQGYSVALLTDHKHNLNAEAQHYLERIHKGATRLDLLIQEVLNYSQMAKMEFKLAPIHLEKLVADILQVYPDLQKMQAQVTVKHPLLDVLGHEALLTQVISNLLGNAVKFVRPGVAPTIRIWNEVSANMVRIWVEDNGIGIDPSHFKRIFEIFGRVHGDKHFSGTGIGLAVVKKAVERMGGAVGVESKLGKGARFWFTLKPT